MGWFLPILAAGSGFGLVAYLASRLASEEGEPAPPIPLPPSPPLPAPPGGSGIDTSVPLPPEEKPADATGVDSAEVEALARVIASEAGSGTPAEQKGIGWTVRNRFRNKSIYAVEHPWREQKGSDPPFSSARDATAASRTLARAILAADQSEDPTGGATAFFEPRMQDVFFKAGQIFRAGESGDRVIDGVRLTNISRFKNYKLDADGVRSKWRPGDTLYATAGRFEFWGSMKLFAKRGGTVKTVIAGDGFEESEEDALARVVENVGGFDCEEQQAIAWTVRNRADRCGVTIGEASHGLLVGDLPPSEWSRAVAASVIRQSADADPTNGAVDFWRPEVQRQGRALGDMGRAFEAENDVVGAAEFAPWRDYASEEDVRQSIEDKGLCVVGMCGTLELLG